jgi:hypothetical protein
MPAVGLSGQVISSMQRPVIDNTQYSEETTSMSLQDLNLASKQLQTFTLDSKTTGIGHLHSVD